MKSWLRSRFHLSSFASFPPSHTRPSPSSSSPLSFFLFLSSGGLTEVSPHPHRQLLPWLCQRSLPATRDGISMDTDQDDTGLWGVGGRQFTAVSSSVCWRRTEGDRGGRGGLESANILNREEQELEKKRKRKSERRLLKGDSFTQFRFSEEKDWEMDSSSASQMSAVFVDLPALAQILQQVPLHQRLNLEAELLQVSTPLELPTLSRTPKQEMPKAATFTPPSAALKTISTVQTDPVATNPPVSSSAAEPPVVDDDGGGDEELDQLLSLQKPVWDVSGSQPVSVADEESAVLEKACEQVKDMKPVLIEEKMDEVKDKDVTPPKSASARQEMTEEDLEDWLDSMIS
ncbi:cell death regulator Aven isoform X1 [Anarhichas minor]|uniref:cell death regulator Aven isoform X1 n=1 Tax=Anarhichas minor TaxID=65739 RepID=UPI003F7333C4